MVSPVAREIQEMLGYRASWVQRVTREIQGLSDHEAHPAPLVLLGETVRREIQDHLVMLDLPECLGALEERVKKDILEEME